MAGIAADIAAIERRIDAAVRGALNGPILDTAKDDISQMLRQYTFPYSRGPGGLSDPVNFHGNVGGGGDRFELVVTDDAPFQNGGGAAGDLADVVETGDLAYRMPGPRPFMEPADQLLGTQADAILSRAVAGI